MCHVDEVSDVDVMKGNSIIHVSNLTFYIDKTSGVSAPYHHPRRQKKKSAQKYLFIGK